MDFDVWIILIFLAVIGAIIFLARKGRQYDRDRGVTPSSDKPAVGQTQGGGLAALGPLLLIVGIIGAFLVLQMDTSVSTGYGRRVNNLGLMNQQQNYLIFCGLLAIVGAILTAIRKG